MGAYWLWWWPLQGAPGVPGCCSPLTGCESVGARLWYVLSAAPGGPDRHSLLIPADQLSVTQRAASRPRSRITGHRSVPPTQAFLMNTFLLSAFLYFTNMPIFTFSWQTSASIDERSFSENSSSYWALLNKVNIQIGVSFGQTQIISQKMWV